MTDTDFTVHLDDPTERVEAALEDLRAGRMVILTDDEDRENEGDLVCAAEKVTPEIINFMATHGRGLICLSMTSQQVARLQLPMMSAINQTPYNTAFTVSIEAREGVTTGISAADRAHTVLTAIRPDATPMDIVTPGHMFPLRARDGGVLERVGQTEGSVDLAKLAGLNPSGVICEIMKPDGTMARMPDLLAFGAEHRLRIVSVADLIKYRMRNERIVKPISEGQIDVPGLGGFSARLYRGIGGDEGQHLALWRGLLGENPTLTRVQSAPPAWGFLGTDISKVARSAQVALGRIAAEGSGALVLMHLGGGGMNSIDHAFRRDVVGREDAPRPPTAADALRDLGTGCQVLRDLGLRDLRLLTNSSRPILGLDAYGLSIVERLPLSAD